MIGSRKLVYVDGECFLQALRKALWLSRYMNIYLLRHAQAESSFPDSQRILSAKGRADVDRLGQFLRSKETPLPEVLWCSPYRRAQETAGLLLEAWGGAVEQRRDEVSLEPDMNPASVAAGLLEVGRDVLVVGHNPNISILASLLLSAERGRTRTNFQTCNMACLVVSPVENFGEVGPCELSWMLDPRML
jgi:phosphohistidine phosphatase SixA